MAAGFNWVPPLSVIDVFGGKDRFLHIVNERIDNAEVINVDLQRLFSENTKSRYDYRPYFKSK